MLLCKLRCGTDTGASDGAVNGLVCNLIATVGTHFHGGSSFVLFTAIITPESLLCQQKGREFKKSL